MIPEPLKKFIVPAAVGLPVLVGIILTFLHGDMGYTLPNINSAYGEEIDSLYRIIMYTVGFVFFLVEGLLVYFVIEYRERPGRKVIYTHGSQKAELIWTIVPGLYLIWLGVYQISSWERIREKFPKASEGRELVQVFPQQYAWDFRHPGENGAFGDEDDWNEPVLKVPVNQNILLKMSSKDVIHSFFLPFARVKMDVLPGMQTRAWFKLDRIPCWDPKKNQAVLLTEPEFKSKRIAMKGFALKDKVRDTTGVRDFYYEPVPGAKVKVAADGKLEDFDPDQARIDYIFHHMDVACAELCGMNHYTMRAFCEVYPQDLYQKLVADKAEEIDGADKWKTIWDKVYAKFNVIDE